MHDYFLSYRSSDRVAALVAKERLEAAGRTVWIDDDPEDELVGIPVGQAHWEVIRRAIDTAGTLIVYDTPAWHESPYCRNELEYAVDSGKRVAVLTPDPGNRHPDLRDRPTAPVDAPEQLVGLLEPGDRLAAAHARLLSELNGTPADQPRRSWFGRRDQAADALALTTAPGLDHGPYLTQPLAEYCASILADAARGRRRLTAAAAVVLVVLTGLTAVAVTQGVTAQKRSGQARESADRAQSLGLAHAAAESGTSADALANAERAVALDVNDAARGALTAIRDELGSRVTLQAPTVPVFGMAVNDAGTVVLGSRDRSVLVGHPGTGRTTVIPSAEGLGRRVAVTADGRTGYVSGRTGRVWCVDIAAGRLGDSGLSDVADLSVQPDGALWWVTSDGRLGHSPSCPGAASPTVPTGLRDVVAFDLSGERDRAYVLTRSAQLATVDLGRGQVLRTVDLTGVAGDDTRTRPALRAIKDPSYVVRCGARVHVLTGIDRRGGLSYSTWAGFGPDGTSTGRRVDNVTMRGLGCGPQDNAWAAPMITPRALALPRSAQYPVGEIDRRDAAGATVIGNSPGRGRTVVAHSDGRIDVLDGAKIAWGQSTGDAAVALPIEGGTVTVDTDGTARFRGAAGVTEIARLTGRPSPWSLTAGRTAIVATAAGIVELDAKRVVRTTPIPGPVSTMTLSRGGDEVVAGGPGWLLGVPLDRAKPTRTLRFPKLTGGEKVMSVQSDGDRLLVSTSYGRILITTPAGDVLHTAGLGVAGATIAVFRADHGVNAAGGDGLLRAYGPSLEPTASLLLGVGAVFARPAVRGTTLVVGFSDFSVWKVDAVTLQPRNRITTRSPDMRLVVPTPDGSRTVVLHPAAGGADAELMTLL